MSLYKDQKETKPKVEDVAAEILDGDKLKNLLNFLAFLKDNKMTPRWQSYNSWSVRYKNKSMCYVNLNERDKVWMIRLSQFTRDGWFTNYDNYFTDEELKKFILDNINPPPCVERGCNGRQNMTIFGKHFDKVCNCWPLRFINLEGTELEFSKKLILTVKSFISDLESAS